MPAPASALSCSTSSATGRGAARLLVVGLLAGGLLGLPDISAQAAPRLHAPTSATYGPFVAGTSASSLSAARTPVQRARLVGGAVRAQSAARQAPRRAVRPLPARPVPTAVRPAAPVVGPTLAPAPAPVVTVSASPTAAAVLAGALLASAPAVAPSVTAPSPSPVVTTAPAAQESAPVPTTPQLGAVAFLGQVDQISHLGDYAYVELNAWEADKAAALKKAHPGLKVLVYKDMSSTREYAVKGGVDDRYLPTGVGYADADHNHPDWFLRDSNGDRMLWPYSGHWWMDVGNAGYQRAWLDNVRAELAAGPWDGVVIDNVMASPEWYIGDRTIARYPDRSAYEAATDSFVRAVGPALRSTGALVLGNISDASPSTWDRWTALMSGGNHEHSFSWNNGVLYGGADWAARIDEIERTQRAGRIHTASSEATVSDVRAQTYIRASWLLAWDGGATGSAQLLALKDSKDPWNAVVATDLGAPLGRRTAVGAAWRREFTGGTAVVNPSNGTVTVPLGAPRKDAAGRTVTSVTLAPLTGALLTS